MREEEQIERGIFNQERGYKRGKKYRRGGGVIGKDPIKNSLQAKQTVSS